MLLQVTLEGLGLGILLVLVCAVGIRKGAVGMVHLYPMGQPFAGIQPGLYAGVQRFERSFCQRLFPVSCKGRGQRDENADREDRIWRQTMKYAGMPMGMWMLMKELGLYDLTPALCHLDYTMSEAGGATDFVRQYTLASGGPYCDCGYKKKGYRKTISHLPRSAEQEPHAQQDRKEDQVG